MSSQKKHIVIFTSEFPPQPGGIGNHAYHLALSLTDNEYKVTVIADARSLPAIDELNFDASLPFIVKRIPVRKVRFIMYIHRIWQAIACSFQCDVFICSGKFPLWVGGVLQWGRKATYIAILHGSELLSPSPPVKKYTHFCVKKFDAVIAVSRYTLGLIPSLPASKASVIQNGFYNPKITKQVTPSSTPLQLITVGNVTQRKGQHNVIAALPTLLMHYPNIHYQMVGIPTQQKKLEAQATRLEALSHISFSGKVSEVDKINALQKSTIFMMLSEATSQGDVEGFGIAILEANALGIPAIGATGCGIEDAIHDNHSGRLVDVHHPEALLACIKDILENYETYSSEAKKWSQQFTWPQVIKKYITVIEQ